MILISQSKMTLIQHDGVRYNLDTLTHEGRYPRILESLSPSNVTGRILDAGCSSGVTTCELAVANPDAQVVGIDINYEQLQRAHTRLKSCADISDRVRFYIGDFYDMRHSSIGRFNLIVSMNTWLYRTSYLTADENAGIATSLYYALSNNGVLLIGKEGGGLCFSKNSRKRRLVFQWNSFEDGDYANLVNMLLRMRFAKKPV